MPQDIGRPATARLRPSVGGPACRPGRIASWVLLAAIYGIYCWIPGLEIGEAERTLLAGGLTPLLSMVVKAS